MRTVGWAKEWTLARPEKSARGGFTAPGTLQHQCPKTGMEQVAGRAEEGTAHVEALQNIQVVEEQ